MIKYKNISGIPLTFYGITFNPNEVKEVPGYINHMKMLRIKEPTAITSKPKAIITLPKQEAAPEVDEQKEIEQPIKKQTKKRKNQK